MENGKKKLKLNKETLLKMGDIIGGKDRQDRTRFCNNDTTGKAGSGYSECWGFCNATAAVCTA